MSGPVRSPEPATVHLITLGCARNEVDSEELAGRLEAGGFRLVAEPADAAAVLVNTCGFVEAAKKDSIDTVLGFDDYADIAGRLERILRGEQHHSHVPRDRRTMLPIAPAERRVAAQRLAIPGHAAPDDLPAGLAPASGPRPVRRRISGGPSAPLKIASGCDRRCSFCAIPSFRGAYVSRPPTEILAEARWLVEQGVREVLLVSENSSSYGKDLGDIRLLERLLTDLAAVDGLDWVRVSYLQPAEMRPSLIEFMASTAGVVPYFDLSFQHASRSVLRRMRRFGDADSFLKLLADIRAIAPFAGIRSNVICGFPGETENDVDVLKQFLVAAHLDAIGVFGYSNEDGTEAASFGGQLAADEIESRRGCLSDLAEELVADRAEWRVGQLVDVLVEEAGTETVGRAAHQGPEVDGSVSLLRGDDSRAVELGDLVPATVVGAEGVDLFAKPVADRRISAMHGNRYA
jgi:ribosomal protein S12 methylthiotransferase